MHWFTKNGRRYYVRRKQLFGRVVREHIGAGLQGEQAAAEDAARRADEQAQRQSLQQKMQRWEAQQKPLPLLTRATDFLTRTALVLSGLMKQAANGGATRMSTTTTTTTPLE
jgi:hypothetical protein